MFKPLTVVIALPLSRKIIYSNTESQYITPSLVSVLSYQIQAFTKFLFPLWYAGSLNQYSLQCEGRDRFLSVNYLINKGCPINYEHFQDKDWKDDQPLFCIICINSLYNFITKICFSVMGHRFNFVNFLLQCWVNHIRVTCVINRIPSFKFVNTCYSDYLLVARVQYYYLVAHSAWLVKC